VSGSVTRHENTDTRDLARRIRIHTLNMTSAAGSSHIAAVLSMADILAFLYGSILRVDPANALWQQRDRFVLSKGHGAAGVYAALAERGFFPVEDLQDYCRDGSRFGGPISHHHVPGVEISTGSLGHGLSVGAGMAYGARLDEGDHRVFVLLSDGECDEGSTWEAILFAAHHGLDHLVAIVDYNKLQSLGPVPETLELEPFADKWRAFGWSVSEVNGHDHDQLRKSLADIPARPGRPTAVLAHTTKGKGVSFMENSVVWHYRSAQGDEYRRALDELEAS
jgi:transketolase